MLACSWNGILTRLIWSDESPKFKFFHLLLRILEPVDSKMIWYVCLIGKIKFTLLLIHLVSRSDRKAQKWSLCPAVGYSFFWTVHQSRHQHDFWRQKTINLPGLGRFTTNPGAGLVLHVSDVSYCWPHISQLKQVFFQRDELFSFLKIVDLNKLITFLINHLIVPDHQNRHKWILFQFVLVHFNSKNFHLRNEWKVLENLWRERWDAIFYEFAFI